MSKEIPILMNMPGGLRFSKDGIWLNDGEPVTHKNIASYFARHLIYDENLASFIVTVNGKCVEVEVEDTPFVALTIDSTKEPWDVLFNDELRCPLNLEQLTVSGSNNFYCQRPDKTLARLLRPAVQALLPFVEERDAGYVLHINEMTYPIKTKE